MASVYVNVAIPGAPDVEEAFNLGVDGDEHELRQAVAEELRRVAEHIERGGGTRTASGPPADAAQRRARP